MRLTTRQMRSIAYGTGVLGAAIVLTACGSSGAASVPANSPAGSAPGATGSASPVKVAAVAGVGIVLEDSAGNVLYSPEQEANGTISCTAQCVKVWPAALASDSAPKVDGAGGTFASIARPDGTAQLSYNGKPLYRFSFDKGPGSATGNDVKDSFGGKNFTWHAVQASGAVAPAPSASSPGSGGGYGNY